MEEIPVTRWVFWAGVAVLVVGVVGSSILTPMLSPPYGASFSLTPLVLLLAVVLLLLSVTPALRDRRASDRGGSSAQSLPR